jgi:hypothetical protein
VVKGYGDGSYQPAFEVTRAMMAVFLANAKGFTTEPAEQSFGDVPESYWAFTQIEQCVQEGLVLGYADFFGEDAEFPDAFLPAATVTRDQMAVFLVRATEGATTGVYDGEFDDIVDEESPGWWAKDEIVTLVDLGITVGYLNGNEEGTGVDFKPAKVVSRDQMAVFLWRALIRPIDGVTDGNCVVLAGPAVSGGEGNDAWLLPAGLHLPEVDMATGAAVGTTGVEIDATMNEDDQQVDAANSFAADDQIMFATDVGGVDPEAVYFVLTATADSFTFSEEEGGDPFEISLDDPEVAENTVLPVETTGPGSVVYVVLDAANVPTGDITFTLSYVKDMAGTMSEADDTFTTADANGLAVGDEITFAEDVGGVDPETTYFVVDVVDATTFQFSEEEDGDAFDVDADGDNVVQTVVSDDTAVAVDQGDARDAVDASDVDGIGMPYLVASYQIDPGLAADPDDDAAPDVFTLTITLPNDAEFEAIEFGGE